MLSMWIVGSAIDYPPELLHLNLIVSKIILEKVVSKILSARAKLGLNRKRIESTLLAKS